MEEAVVIILEIVQVYVLLFLGGVALMALNLKLSKKSKKKSNK